MPTDVQKDTGVVEHVDDQRDLQDATVTSNWFAEVAPEAGP